METVGKKVIKLNFVKGFCAQFATAVSVIIGSMLGLPLSTTHCMVGSLLGIVAAEKLKFVQFSYLDETQSDLHSFFKNPADKFEEVPDSSQKSKKALVNTQDTETNLISSGDDEPEERKNSVFEAIGNARVYQGSMISNNP